ncbi:Ppx/GppA family phosphatase [Campylobacter sp. LR286c]|uniref:Ppx/GppA phosphatase family protein n=1 Tax=Campylobacter sp. LR286c TaxID=2593545 RepID=UPI001237B499|nr:Ppx/GppA family phosphatase [Campylobacter sp. LR286c]KAA6227337.1 Ppx/GppA family phosphatase [Campylobacter sp. LR286c]
MLGIDLGSNTMRGVVMDENFKKIDSFEFIIGAAKNLNESGKIGDEAILRLKNALTKLKKYDLKNARAFATAAFRKANNTNEIFENLKNEFDINFKTIDAKTEARLSILGMKFGLRNLKMSGEFGFIDLGGASCEFTFKSYFQSFDFGIISFYERAIENPLAMQSALKCPFLKNTKNKRLKLQAVIKDKKLLNLAFKAFEEVKFMKKMIHKMKCKNIVLNSGVPTTLVSLKQGLRYDEYDSNLINGKSLSKNDFLYLGLKIWSMSENEAKKWVGSMRKNYLVAGCFLFYSLLENEKIIVVDEGLREGICLEKVISTFS